MAEAVNSAVATEVLLDVAIGVLYELGDSIFVSASLKVEILAFAELNQNLNTRSA